MTEPTSAQRRAIARRIRSKAYLAARAADPGALQPLERDAIHPARATLHELALARGIQSPAPWAVAPRAWHADRWALTRAYVTAELYRTGRTIEFCASLAAIAARRLGTSIAE